MAAGDHIHPFGATLKYGPAAGSESITIGEVLDIEPPSVKRGKSNDTTLISTNAVGENSAGWGDPSEAKATVYLVGTAFVLLKAVETSRLTKHFLVTLAKSPNQTVGGDSIQFGAWVGELKLTKAEQMSEDKLKCEIMLQMSGDLTYTAGS